MRASITMLALALACTGEKPATPPAGDGGGDGGGTDDTATTGDDSGAAGECATYGIGDFVRVPLPPLPGDGPWRSTSDGLCGDDTEHLFTLDDIDGDGLDDLLTVRDCAKQDGTGQDHWVVFKGVDGGWSDTAVEWTLPEPRVPYGWVRPTSRSCEGPSQSIFDVLDVTGDGRFDLVLFDACHPDSPVGQGVWMVYPGEDGGFSQTGQEWTVSETDGARDFTLRQKDACGEDATPRYGLLDVDGDGYRDLLLTGDCGAHSGLGSTHWVLHKGTGSGFALDAPITLALPDLGSELPVTGAQRCESESDIVYGFGDIDEDGDRDLIVSGHCDGRAEPGTTRWDYYAFDGDVLSSTPSTFAMPDIGVERAWVRNPDTRCSEDRPTAQGFWDVNGDGYGDMVIREMCAPGAPEGLGVDHYRLWLRNPDLTYGEERRFELPADDEGSLWVSMSDDFCGHPGDAIVSARDITGDLAPDALMTYACDTDAPTGWTEWGVALAGCLDPSR